MQCVFVASKWVPIIIHIIITFSVCSCSRILRRELRCIAYNAHCTQMVHLLPVLKSVLPEHISSVYIYRLAEQQSHIAQHIE